MAGGRCEVTDIRELLRRIRVGDSDRRIAWELDLSRNTVARCRRWAQEQGLLAGGPLEAAQMVALLHANAEHPLFRSSPAWPRSESMWRHGFTGSYSAVNRFPRRLQPSASQNIRIEVPPGEEAHVHFGFAGLLLDPEGKKYRMLCQTVRCQFQQVKMARVAIWNSLTDLARTILPLVGPTSREPSCSRGNQVPCPA